MRTRKYNRDNCDNRLRAVFTDSLGRTIALFGRHAFEYKIVFQSNGKTVIRTFPNGETARKEFNNLKRRR